MPNREYIYEGGRERGWGATDEGEGGDFCSDLGLGVYFG